VTLALLLASANLLDSRTGRAIRALRFRGVMAESFGVDVLRLKTLVFLYAALFAGSRDGSTPITCASSARARST